MRKLATFCAAFAVGVAAAHYLLPPRLLPPAAAGFAVLGALWAFFLKGEQRLRVGIVALGLTAALGYDWAYRAIVFAPHEALAGSVRSMTVELCGYAEPTQYGARVPVRLIGSGLPGRAFYYGDESILSLEPGARLTGTVRVESAATVRETDITTFTSRGVFSLLYAKGPAAVSDGNAGSVRYFPQRLAQRSRGAIAACFPESSQPFLLAITLGDRSRLSEEDAVCLQEAGLFHVTAVSGLHCAFLLSLLSFLIGKHRRLLLAAVTIPVLALYALAVGATPSVLRASVMIALVLLAPLFGRESDAPTSLCFALLLILLHNPFAAASVSLQLSFGATAGILWLTPRLYERIRSRNRAVRFLLGSLSATAGALVFTAPLSAAYFGCLPLVSPLSNLLCLWAASLTFVTALPTVAAGIFLPQLARIAAYLPHLGAQYILLCARQLTRIPNHAVYFENAYLKVWLVYVYALLAVCFLAKKGRLRYVTAGALAALTLGLTLWTNAAIVAGGMLRVSTLNVGQGQSVVVLSEGESALIDCGSSNSYLSAGEITADYLQSAGINRLNAIVLSHYHADHVNGLPVLLARVRADRLILPDIEEGDPLRGAVLSLAERYGIPVTFVTRSQRVALGAAELTVYPPVGAGDMNEECLAVLCTTGTFDALFTADMDANTEYRLLAEYDLPDLEVLMVGHHGSRYSTGGDLLAQTKPEVGVISCGVNSYGHPGAETLRRLEEADVRVYRTDRQGTIHIRVN